MTEPKIIVDNAAVYPELPREDLCLKRLAHGDRSGWCLLKAGHVNGCDGPVGDPLPQSQFTPTKKG